MVGITDKIKFGAIGFGVGAIVYKYYLHPKYPELPALNMQQLSNAHNEIKQANNRLTQENSQLRRLVNESMQRLANNSVTAPQKAAGKEFGFTEKLSPGREFGFAGGANMRYLPNTANGIPVVERQRRYGAMPWNPDVMARQRYFGSMSSPSGNTETNSPQPNIFGMV